MTAPPFDPEQDLPPDGATWTGVLPGTPSPGVRTWTFEFPNWVSADHHGRPELLARAFDPAGLNITRRWAETEATPPA